RGRLPPGARRRAGHEHGVGNAVPDERPDHPEVIVAEYKGLQLIVQPTDSEHRGFFEEARQHRLVVQRGQSCGLLRAAPGSACPFCTSPDWVWHPVSGRGEIYSYQIVTQAVQPAFRDWVPYPVVLVELDEQKSVPWHGGADRETVSLRIVANLVAGD